MQVSISESNSCNTVTMKMPQQLSQSQSLSTGLLKMWQHTQRMKEEIYNRENMRKHVEEGETSEYFRPQTQESERECAREKAQGGCLQYSGGPA